MPTNALEPSARHVPWPPTTSCAPPEPAAETRPNQSVRAGLRVVRVLHDLGPYDEHQVAAIAEAAGLRTPHVSRLLAAAVAEGVAERGARHGSYRLTRTARGLLGERAAGQSGHRIRQTLELLHAETGLAVAYHQPGWRPDTGLHLELVDAVSPADSELHNAIARQNQDLRHSAAGRAALTFLPDGVTTGPDGRPVPLPAGVRATVASTRIAVSRTATTHALATCVLRAGSAVAVLTALGPTEAFADPLLVQEYAVLLRRTAQRYSTPSPATRPAHNGRDAARTTITRDATKHAVAA